MSHIQALENEIASLKEEFEKFERGNKSAGTRARKVLQNIKRISQDIRIQIQTSKKSEDKKA
jgi:exonuclease VII small subunit